MNKIILGAVLIALSSVAYAKPTFYGVVEQNVEIARGFEAGTDMDSGDSAFGIKGLINLDDGLRLAYKIQYSVDSEGDSSSNITDASVAINSPKYGTITLGKFESFMRLQSLRTVDIFEAGDGQGTTFDGRLDNAVSYTTPSFNGFVAGITLAADGQEEGEENVDKYEYVARYSYGPLYLTGVYLDDAAHGITNLFGAVKYTTGSITYVIGAEEVDNGQGISRSVMLGAQIDSGKNSYKFGTQRITSIGKTSTYTAEYSRKLGKSTTANFNIQFTNSFEPGENGSVTSIGIRHDF